MRIGCQISIAKGLDKSAEMAHEIKANCFQFFTRNPRGGAARVIPSTEATMWSSRRQEADIYPIVGHLPYTVNLASPKPETYQFATETIAADLTRMDQIGAEYLVVHPGSRSKLTVDEGIARVAGALETGFMPFAGNTMLLLESMSGQSGEVGSIEEIGAVIKCLGSPKGLGLCIDTCHLFAAGYNFRQLDEVERMVCDIDKHVGLERLKCVHINDSKFGPGQHKDRHELVGLGHIGREGLVHVLAHPLLRSLPFVLETPVEDYQGYSREIARLRAWLEER